MANAFKGKKVEFKWIYIQWNVIFSTVAIRRFSWGMGPAGSGKYLCAWIILFTLVIMHRENMIVNLLS